MKFQIIKPEKKSNLYETLIPIYEKLILVLVENDYVITNGYMGTVFQDNSEFKPLADYDPILLTRGAEKYEVGSIKEKRIFIDPLMKWTDTRLLFYKNNELVEEIKVDVSDVDLW